MKKYNHKKIEKKWPHSAKASRGMQKKYNHKRIESYWQQIWEENKIYQPDIKKATKPFYNLMMFPYPSAEGLHVGNMYAFTGADVYGRFKRMMGNDVFEPIGLDGFGIHSENYALKVGTHPREQAQISQENFYRQLRAIGNGFDWSHKLETYDPDYYRWTQWLFIQMYKNGLAYRGKAMVNWCPSCKTVLADEQVEAGLCERCKSAVERREMEQWFFKITRHADRLLKNIEKIDWPEKIKIAQRQWIGKKEGAEVEFSLSVPGQEEGKHTVNVFTTRLDTIGGVTFLTISPELAKKWLDVGWQAGDKVRKYVLDALAKSDQERLAGAGEKTGVDTGVKAINPVSQEKVPVWVADYVLGDVGTGAVMGVPAHDERDFEFAKKHGLMIKMVVAPLVGAKTKNKAGTSPATTDAFSEKGTLINSGKYNGLKSDEAIERIQKDFPEKIKKTHNYHLRDWLISRQRYWGPPIPIVYCRTCWENRSTTNNKKPTMKNIDYAIIDGKEHVIHAVAEEQLPVALPDIDDWQPKGDGKGPLEKAPDAWLYTKCPKCGGKAKRETDVSDTFLDSSWYHFRYPSIETANSHQPTANGKKTANIPWDPKITKKWLPVNAYIGGAEHAVLHLLYARFVCMALADWGYVDFEEPYPFLFSHGLIIKDGAKMSKSRGNVVNPDEYIQKFGADTLRMYLMFLGSYDQGGDFRDSGIAGMRRFLDRVWQAFTDEKKVGKKTTETTQKKLHQTIRDMTADIPQFKYNTAIARFMEFINVLRGEGETITKKDASNALRLIAPIAPHTAEELYQFSNKQQTTNSKQRFDSIHFQKWPEYDKAFVQEDTVTIVVQVNGKLRSTLRVDQQTAESRKQTAEKAKKDENVKKYLKGKKIKKEIFVPGRLVNFVV